ncbi:MAG: ATP-binding protein [Legionellales bacterium]|nr:ATP-binding protein [Legionellales bacterium]
MMIKPRRYFPLGKAYGEAFCNRSQELKELISNIENGKHTFLAAPRRYGKSSLCEKALIVSELPFSKIDLHVATTEKELERCIVKGIIDLIGSTISVIDKAIQNLKHTFKNLKPKLSLEKSGFKIEFEVENEASTPEVLREIIIVLDKLLITKNKHAILLIDEFQRVMEIAPNMGVEGGIRSAAQETQNLAIIFSGSNRHMIESIFQDEGRPLYKLCRKIKLNRIAEEHYNIHLNKIAKLMWKSSLPESTFFKIMELTERHPYYVNYLCDYLWMEHVNLPNEKNVEAVWEKIVDEERSDLLKDYFNLPENPKKLLKFLALHPDENIYSLDASMKMSMPTTSVSNALRKLLDDDMIEAIPNKKFRVINPAYKLLLRG